MFNTTPTVGEIVKHQGQFYKWNSIKWVLTLSDGSGNAPVVLVPEAPLSDGISSTLRGPVGPAGVAGAASTIAGPAGIAGATGAGVAAGGTAGQLLFKASATEYSTEWRDAPAATAAGTEVWRSDTPPTDTTRYTLWFDTTTLQLKVYVADSQAYVDSMPPSIPGTSGQGVPAGGTTGQVLVKSGADDYATAWSTPAAGSAPFDWTNAWRASAMSTTLGSNFVPFANGMNIRRLGTVARKNPSTSVFSQNKLDAVNGVYLNFTTADTYQMAGIHHEYMPLTTKRGFKIFEVFGLETFESNPKLTAFIGLSQNFWGTDFAWRINLPAQGYNTGIGFRDNDTTWQIVLADSGSGAYYIDTGIPKPSGNKLLYTFEMSCVPDSSLIKIILKDITNGTTICNRFIEVYSDQSATVFKVGTTGDYGIIGAMPDHSPHYFYNLFSTGALVASPLSFVHSRSQVETLY